MTSNNTSNISKFYVYLCLGIVFTIAAYKAIDTYYFLKNGQKTQGKVLEVIEVKSRKGYMLYSPKIIFIDIYNNTHTFVPNIADNFSYFNTGDTLEIIYNPTNLNEIKINRFEHIWLSIIIMIFISFSFLIFIIALMRKNKIRELF